MAEDFESIKKEIQEKNKLIDKLNSCKNKDRNKIQQSKLELEKLLYIYYKYITRGNCAKAFL
jgi:hypothetical protein